MVLSTRFFRATAAALLLTAGLAGCGDDDPSGSARDAAGSHRADCHGRRKLDPGELDRRIRRHRICAGAGRVAPAPERSPP